MSITSEIERIKTNIANAYTELENKGATIPTEKNSNNLASTITTVTGGGDIEIPEKAIIYDTWDTNGYPTSVKIKGFTSIPSYAFYVDSTSTGVLAKTLTNVELDNTVTEIGTYGFRGCSSLETINLEKIVTTKSSAFYNCSALSNIDLSSIVTLGDATFMYCRGITQNIILPETLIELSGNAFFSCINIPKIDILSQNAYTLKNGTFKNCTGLQALILRSNTLITLTGTTTFDNSSIAQGTGYIYVPDDLVEEYKSATNWSTYAAQIKGISELPTE